MAFSTTMPELEFVAWLLDYHDQLYRDSGDHRNLALRFDKTEPKIVRIQNHLDRRIPPYLTTSSPLTAARDWWSEMVYTAKYEIFLHAHMLLRHLDALFSTRPPQNFIVGNDRLFLGRRWWNARARDMQARAPLNGLKFSVDATFPHVRIAKNGARDVLYERRKTFFDAISHKMLRIGLCSFSGGVVTVFQPTGRVTTDGPTFGFAATGMTARDTDNGSLYEAEIRAAFDWARREQVHVLCFPELSICPVGRTIICEELNRDPGCLALIVGGSFHVSEGRQPTKNTAPYWVVDHSSAAEEIDKYEKTQALGTAIDQAKKLSQMKETCRVAEEDHCVSVVEDIYVGDRGHLIQTPLGIFGLLICKDLLADDDLVARYRAAADHLLVVSMNAAATAWFFGESEKLARHACMSTFYVNCTQIVESASDSEVDIVFWHAPAGPGRRKRRYFRAANIGPLRKVLPADGLVAVSPFEIPDTLRTTP